MEEKRKILAHVVEIAVVVMMSTHLYTFGGETFIQSSGGPIGMRATASLASVIMKIWDVAWCNLMKREGIKMDLVVRYVDDCRMFMPCINEGWFWDNGSFQFDWQKREKDLESEETGEERTTKEVTKAMNTIVSFSSSSQNFHPRLPFI